MKHFFIDCFPQFFIDNLWYICVKWMRAFNLLIWSISKLKKKYIKIKTITDNCNDAMVNDTVNDIHHILENWKPLCWVWWVVPRAAYIMHTVICMSLAFEQKCHKRDDEKGIRLLWAIWWESFTLYRVAAKDFQWKKNTTHI